MSYGFMHFVAILNVTFTSYKILSYSNELSICFEFTLVPANLCSRLVSLAGTTYTSLKNQDAHKNANSFYQHLNSL